MFANITWPSLVYFQRERAWWLILAAILVEFFLLRRSLKTTALRAFVIVVVINVFSALVGSLLTVTSEFGRIAILPSIGLFWTLHVDHGHFTYDAFCFTVPCAAILSTLIEGLCLFTVFYKMVSKRCLLWLPLANLASAELTFVCLGLTLPVTTTMVVLFLLTSAVGMLVFAWRRRALRRRTMGTVEGNWD